MADLSPHPDQMVPTEGPTDGEHEEEAMAILSHYEPLADDRTLTVGFNQIVGMWNIHYEHDGHETLHTLTREAVQEELIRGRPVHAKLSEAPDG